MMVKILVAGAGGAPSEGVINSLLRVGIDVVGIGSEPTDLVFVGCTEKILGPLRQ